MSSDNRQPDSPQTEPEANTSVSVLADVIASRDRTELYTALVQWLSRRPGCFAAAAFIGQPDGGLSTGPHTFRGPPFEGASVHETVQSAAAESAAAGRKQTVDMKQIRNAALVSIPVRTGRSSADIISAAFSTVDDQQPNADDLEAAAAYAGLWYGQRSSRKSRPS